jgi:mRNA interferase HigB
VRVVNVTILDDYMAEHARCRAAVKAWLAEVREAAWPSPVELKQRYPKASLLSGNRVVFNLAGNHYRLLCTVAYQTLVVVVNRIGTHGEYDKWTL